MNPSNFHTHTVFCDGKNTPEELVLKAVDLGCEAIGFSGHAYTPFDKGYCMSPAAEKEYIEAVLALKEKYAKKIRIFLGREQDYYAALPEFDYDYLIGSVHYVQKNGVFISVDDTPQVLENGIDRYYGGDPYALAEDYYKNVADLYGKTKCNIIGHFDILTKYNRDHRFFDTRHPRYIAAYTRALEALFETDCAFEINTHRSPGLTHARNYPDAEIEAIIRANGRKIVYSSDCHEKDFLIAGLPEDYDNIANIPRLK